MKITKKLLGEAVEAAEENHGPFTFDLDSGEITELLWMALKSILSHEKEPRDHKVTLRVEAFLGGLITDPGEIEIR